jgi:hypothetical protein
MLLGAAGKGPKYVCRKHALTKPLLRAFAVVTLLLVLSASPLLVVKVFSLGKHRSIGAARMYRSLSEQGSFTDYVCVLPVPPADWRVVLNSPFFFPSF